MDDLLKPIEQPVIVYFAEIIGRQGNDGIEAKIESKFGQVNGFAKARRSGSGKQPEGWISFANLNGGFQNRLTFPWRKRRPFAGRAEDQCTVTAP